jgi:biopolymer transport protein ExbB
MKKIVFLIAIIGLLGFGANPLNAQQDTSSNIQTVKLQDIPSDQTELPNIEKPMHQRVKKLFIEGGAVFMSFVLICLILGLAFSIERILYLSLANTNTKKLLDKIETALDKGGVDAAKEVCRNTRGPVASIFYQGLDRAKEGIEMVEKSIIAYGSVQMGLLEKGLTWIALFIALAPMLGFLGTVIGMIDAFNSIHLSGEISPDAVAGGIKIALITTVGGLIVAIILQLFYNLILSIIDTIVHKMEDSSITVIDLLVKYYAKNNQHEEL